jgi:hypothetical protein
MASGYRTANVVDRVVSFFALTVRSPWLNSWMNSASLLTLAISVAPGVAVTVFTLIYKARQSRGSANLSRAIGFFDLHDRLVERGPLTDPAASKTAEQAHAGLLVKLEREGRAQSVLYLKNAARLRRPGDFIRAILLIAYGGGLTIGAFGNLAHAGSLSTRTEASALVGFIVLGAFGVPLLIVGFTQLARRLETRRIRREVGLMDSSTLEGIDANVRGFTTAVKTITRRPGKE